MKNKKFFGKAVALVITVVLLIVAMPTQSAEECCECMKQRTIANSDFIQYFVTQIAIAEYGTVIPTTQGDVNVPCLVACMFAVGLTSGVVLIVLAGIEGGQSIYAALIAAGVLVTVALAILECYALCGGGGGGSFTDVEIDNMMQVQYGINRFWLS
jgi:hypothetical protein